MGLNNMKGFMSGIMDEDYTRRMILKSEIQAMIREMQLRRIPFTMPNGNLDEMTVEQLEEIKKDLESGTTSDNSLSN